MLSASILLSLVLSRKSYIKQKYNKRCFKRIHKMYTLERLYERFQIRTEVVILGLKPKTYASCIKKRSEVQGGTKMKFELVIIKDFWKNISFNIFFWISLRDKWWAAFSYYEENTLVPQIVLKRSGKVSCSGNIYSL